MTSTIPVQVPYRPEFFSGFNFTSAQVVFITAKIVLIFIVVEVVVVVVVVVVVKLLKLFLVWTAVVVDCIDLFI